MKINKLVAIALITVASISSLSAAGGIEPEYASLNLPQARKLGSEHLRQTRLAPPPAAAHHATLAGTDTDALVKAVDDGDNNDFVVLAKAAVSAATDAWIDSILAADGAFTVVATAVGPNLPANHTRDSFKAGLTAAINAVASVTPAPANKGMNALSNTRAAVVAEFDAALDAWIDTNLAANAAFLDAGIVIPAVPYAPADHTRDAFKVALSAVVNAL